uniref:Uncharacterized protein n=1 Tax=Lepeophtheirus salmonis TaxID=72036 RepID=A0A0K2TLE7_LEPSM
MSHKFMLFDPSKPCKIRGLNVYFKHGSTTMGYILDYNIRCLWKRALQNSLDMTLIEISETGQCTKPSKHFFKSVNC